MPPTNLKSKVRALQLNTEGLLKLLGGSSDDKQRFWEILKGITTPAELRLVTSELENMTAAVKQVQAAAKAVSAAAGQIARG
jgi:methyl-accepting chemotaxis protein